MRFERFKSPFSFVPSFQGNTHTYTRAQKGIEVARISGERVKAAERFKNHQESIQTHEDDDASFVLLTGVGGGGGKM